MEDKENKEDEEDFLTCNSCKKDIFDFEEDLFHSSGIINGAENRHIHLCLRCFDHFSFKIPILINYDKDIATYKNGISINNGVNSEDRDNRTEEGYW